MADITLKFDAERMILDDLLRLEENEGSVRVMMEVLSKHVVNGDGSFLEPEDGFEALRAMTLQDLRAASDTFRDAATGEVDPK